MLKLIAPFALLFSLTTHADLPKAYDCEVMVVAADLLNGSTEFKYVANVATPTTHGGPEYNFEYQKHKLTVVSDAKWLGITWTRDGKLVTQAVTVRAEENQKSQVLIVYNPADPSEQASVGCTAKP